MVLMIQKTPSYHADVTRQFGWYFDEAGEELAWRFFNAADQTPHKLARQPDLGSRQNSAIHC
jgi:plasmid stabilization system protein ParE